MKLEEKLGIKKELLIQIQGIFSKFKCVQRAVIFGSRARENYKYNSDIDIASRNCPFHFQFLLWGLTP